MSEQTKHKKMFGTRSCLHLDIIRKLAHCIQKVADPCSRRQILDLFLETTELCVLSDRRDGVVVRASASQSVDLGFIPLVESYQKTLKNGIYSFPAWRSAFMGGCGEQAGKFACCVLGQGT